MFVAIESSIQVESLLKVFQGRGGVAHQEVRLAQVTLDKGLVRMTVGISCLPDRKCGLEVIDCIAIQFKLPVEDADVGACNGDLRVCCAVQSLVYLERLLIITECLVSIG